jgi:hypothetical protein
MTLKPSITFCGGTGGSVAAPFARKKRGLIMANPATTTHAVDMIAAVFSFKDYPLLLVSFFYGLACFN